jgi:hypothetical protein
MYSASISGFATTDKLTFVQMKKKSGSVLRRCPML